MTRAVVVTGAAGGIGSALCRRLRADGYVAVGMDRTVSTDADIDLQIDLRDSEAVTAAARELERTMPKQSSKLVLVNETNFALYTPFLPEAVSGMTTHGLTILMDVPRVADAERALQRMFEVGRSLSVTLTGRLVDDNRAVLTAAPWLRRWVRSCPRWRG